MKVIPVRNIFAYFDLCCLFLNTYWLLPRGHLKPWVWEEREDLNPVFLVRFLCMWSIYLIFFYGCSFITTSVWRRGYFGLFFFFFNPASSKLQDSQLVTYSNCRQSVPPLYGRYFSFHFVFQAGNF